MHPSPSPHVATIAAAAQRRQLLVGAAESCTGGLLCGALTDIAGASAWFMGGITAYNNRIKERLLSVPKAVLLQYGAVSEETAQAMCNGLFHFGVSAAVSITGIAGPDGGTAEKPVGYVCFGFRIGDTPPSSDTQQFSGGRADIRTAAVDYALATFASMLNTTD